MSAEAPKPVVGVETAPAPVESTPVAAQEVTGEKTSAPVEEAPKVDETPKIEGDAAAAAPVEEKKEEKAEEKAEEKVVEPIYSGALGYKAPGLKK